MIGKKELHFQDKNIDLDSLASKIESYLQNEHFHTQSASTSGSDIVIQAQKGGFLDKVIDADRALTISLSGSPEDVTVNIGIAKWVEHLAVAAVETLLLSDIFLVVDVGESLWTLEIEDKLVKEIESMV